jgi:hypothetical protein
MRFVTVVIPINRARRILGLGRTGMCCWDHGGGGRFARNGMMTTVVAAAAMALSRRLVLGGGHGPSTERGSILVFASNSGRRRLCH